MVTKSDDFLCENERSKDTKSAVFGNPLNILVMHFNQQYHKKQVLPFHTYSSVFRVSDRLV